MNPLMVEIILFILKNRVGTKSFKNWTAIDILSNVINSLKNGVAVVDSDNQNIYGILIGDIDRENKILYVRELLIKKQSTGVLKRMLIEFEKRYKGYTISARRNNHIIKYNTPRLVNLLNKISK